MDSKIDQKFDGFLGRSWKGSGAPKGSHGGFRSARPGSTGKGREGVNPPQGRRREEGLKDFWKGMSLNHLSSGLVGAAAYYQIILYNSKQRQDCLKDLARLGPLARRISLGKQRRGCLEHQHLGL